eukprot:GILI01003207.1.p1 GENE.GILI01003207.1~~GILI01003207.1.p1  ORF type:complete len:1112 (-),score=400.07 GILI01003207.1:81-3107(-)
MAIGAVAAAGYRWYKSAKYANQVAEIQQIMFVRRTEMCIQARGQRFQQKMFQFALKLQAEALHLRHPEDRKILALSQLALSGMNLVEKTTKMAVELACFTRMGEETSVSETAQELAEAAREAMKEFAKSVVAAALEVAGLPSEFDVGKKFGAVSKLVLVVWNLKEAGLEVTEAIKTWKEQGKSDKFLTIISAADTARDLATDGWTDAYESLEELMNAAKDAAEEGMSLMDWVPVASTAIRLTKSVWSAYKDGIKWANMAKMASISAESFLGKSAYRVLDNYLTASKSSLQLMDFAQALVRFEQKHLSKHSLPSEEIAKLALETRTVIAKLCEEDGQLCLSMLREDEARERLVSPIGFSETEVEEQEKHLATLTMEGPLADIAVSATPTQESSLMNMGFFLISRLVTQQERDRPDTAFKLWGCRICSSSYLKGLTLRTNAARKEDQEADQREWLQVLPDGALGFERAQMKFKDKTGHFSEYDLDSTQDEMVADLKLIFFKKEKSAEEWVNKCHYTTIKDEKNALPTIQASWWPWSDISQQAYFLPVSKVQSSNCKHVFAVPIARYTDKSLRTDLKKPAQQEKRHVYITTGAACRAIMPATERLLYSLNHKAQEIDVWASRVGSGIRPPGTKSDVCSEQHVKNVEIHANSEVCIKRRVCTDLEDKCSEKELSMVEEPRCKQLRLVGFTNGDVFYKDSSKTFELVEMKFNPKWTPADNRAAVVYDSSKGQSQLVDSLFAALNEYMHAMCPLGNSYAFSAAQTHSPSIKDLFSFADAFHRSTTTLFKCDVLDVETLTHAYKLSSTHTLREVNRLFDKVKGNKETQLSGGGANNVVSTLLNKRLGTGKACHAWVPVKFGEDCGKKKRVVSINKNALERKELVVDEKCSEDQADVNYGQHYYVEVWYATEADGSMAKWDTGALKYLAQHRIAPVDSAFVPGATNKNKGVHIRIWSYLDASPLMEDVREMCGKIVKVKHDMIGDDDDKFEDDGEDYDYDLVDEDGDEGEHEKSKF